MNSKKLIIICAAIIISIAGVSSVLILTHNSQEETELSITSPSTIVIGDNVSVKLAAENGTSIANQTINISLISPDGKKITVNAVTDDEGIASYGISDISAGNYTLECLFEGNDEYKESNATSPLEVKEMVVEKHVTKSSDSEDSNSCHHGYPSIYECPTCYNKKVASEWAYFDPSTAETPEQAQFIKDHNAIIDAARK
ncbi:MAG: Ig-like domain-containing protein [Methanobrevibacter sp.]|uniref:Ig-like domain-containing protein n=1 Tax=Methanobrevibacter sp. TaxID=66852 RepID=UPI0026E0D72C|nr:Ig-like domain-containing protein [Methanobrevibacter sp.]MDO5849426.1 Ig-like domain-containing protein [Methanobrevibacter sp.]